MTIANKLDLGEYLNEFSSLLAREKEFILQGDINTHYKYIKALEEVEFTPPKPVKNLDTPLNHLTKQGVLALEDIYEFIKIIDYFAYLKKLPFEGVMRKWLDEITLEEEILECSAYFNKKGEFDIERDETLFGLHQALKRNKEEIKQKLYGITNSSNLQNFLVDRQVHYINREETILVRGGFNNVLKATVVGRSSGGFFYVIPQSVAKLKDNESGIVSKIEEIKYRYCKEISQIFARYRRFLGFVNNAFDRFDHYQARMQLAKSRDLHFVLPQKKQQVHLSEFLHPALKEGVSTEVALDKRVMIVTGVNAGGKTMLLKSILSAVFLSKYLLPMNCNAQKTKIGHFKNIEAIIDDPQSVKNDISTFAGRMVEFSKIFQKSSAIVGVDEIELGTDSDEAASLFRVILAELVKKEITLIVTTHHKRLASLMAGDEQTELVAALYDQKRQSPTYTFLQGAIGKSYAFETAQRYGIPKQVVDQAKEVFGEDKQRLNELIEKSTLLEGELRQKIAKVDRKLENLAVQERELKEQKRTMEHEIEQKIAQMEREYSEAAKLLKGAVNKDQKQKHRALNEAHDKKQKARRHKQKAVPKQEEAELKIGDWVQYNNSKGQILRLDRKKATLEVNGMTLTVKKSALKPVGKPKPKQDINVSVEKGGGFVKLDLHGMRYEEAREELDAFVSNALLHSFDEVFVYHGVGSGALAKMVKEFCKAHPRIKKCEDAAPNQGGVGATVIKF